MNNKKRDVPCDTSLFVFKHYFFQLALEFSPEQTNASQACSKEKEG
jgi:hypothetical protein